MRGREPETAGSLARRLLPLVYALAAALAFLLLLVWVAMQCQIALASFLNADTSWMTARSRAMTELLSYAETGDPEEYAEYEREVAVVDAFGQAREQLLSGRFDYAQVRATLQSGGATVVSPRNTIYVFAHFSRAPYLRDAVAAWRSVDPFLAEWQHIAGALREAYAHGRPGPAEIAHKRSRLVVIDRKMATTNAQFSQDIIRGAVVAGRALYAVIFLLAAIAIALWLAMARRVLARAHADHRSSAVSDASV